ncbi:uncharacterized protein LOC114308101 [Camellia sinensis]|uniref:uncharacterized protein LOC114308101 n=1 Tax=Camellia sinensis TaxID=4442 RepID=UPI001036AF6D|nr:uncharacterized protein LOC114308101 [Camellia sinensis]
MISSPLKPRKFQLLCGVGHRKESCSEASKKTTGGVFPTNQHEQNLTVEDVVVVSSSKPLDGLASTDENTKEANMESYGPWMLVNRRGPRKNLMGGRESKFGSKGKAHMKDMSKPTHFIRATHLGESSIGPSLLHQDLPSADIPVLEESVVTDNPFTTLTADNTLMDSSAVARASPLVKAFPAGVSISAEPWDKALKPSLPSPKEPPDPNFSSLPKVSLPNISSISEYGDSRGESTQSPNKHDLSFIRSRERSHSPNRCRLVDRRGSSHSRVGGDRHLRQKEHHGQSEFHSFISQRQAQSKEDIGDP